MPYIEFPLDFQSISFKELKTYSGVHIRIDKPPFMKQMAYFWSSFVGNKNATTLQPFRLHFSIDSSSKMRYCMNFYLDWHWNQERSKLKATYLLNKKLTFNFNHSQFLCQLRQKFIQHLNLKFHSIPKWNSVGCSTFRQ